MLKIMGIIICVTVVFLFAYQVQAKSVDYKVVYANISGWQDTGLYVQQGDKICFSAEKKDEDKNSYPAEQVWYGGGNHEGGADGCRVCGSNPAGEKALVPGARHMGLVGRIDDDAPFYIGKTCRIRVNRAGKLYLGCNDALNEKDPNGYRDNSGEINVKITID